MRSDAFWFLLAGAGLAGCSAGGTAGPVGNGGTGGAGVTGVTGGATSLGGASGGAPGGSAGAPSGLGGSAAGSSGAGGGNINPGGSGGGSGSGGAGGPGGSGGSAGGGGEFTGCSGADIVCDDFEAAALSTVDWRATAQAMPALSSERAHSGTQSLAFAPEGNIGRFLTTQAPFPAGGELHVRAFMNFELATVDMSGHTGFIVGATADSNGQELRLGQSQPGCVSIDQLLDLNHIPSDATMCSSGHVSGGNPNDFLNPGETLQAGTWYCVETFWDTNVGELRIWVDGRELEVLHATSQTWCPAKDETCTPPNPWPIDFTMVKFGTQVYNGMVGTIWYDDVAYATSRVGCD